MSAPRGRPHVSSREMLADAACELFLEQGYERTSVTEITRRAGVSRSSFFNYFGSKPDTVWFAFDEHLGRATVSLGDSSMPVEVALRSFGVGEPPETLALAIVDARTMGIERELLAGRAERQFRLGGEVAARLERDGMPELEAGIAGAGIAAALVGAVWQWAALGAGRHSLEALVGDGIAAARRMLALE